MAGAFASLSPDLSSTEIKDFHVNRNNSCDEAVVISLMGQTGHMDIYCPISLVMRIEDKEGWEGEKASMEQRLATDGTW